MTDETLPPSVDAVTAEAEPLALAHTINGASLAGITFKNALLTILTLGIWSFWAKTRVRRYLWSNIQIAGDPFQYTGTGFELFKGAIIALLILAALFVPLGILSTAGYQAITTPIQFLIFILLTPLGMFFARRYRLSRTEWRGIRAGFSGDWKAFAFKSAGLTLLSILTLGLAAPFRRVFIERYFWCNSFFGTEKFGTTLQFRHIALFFYIAWAVLAAGILIDFHDFQIVFMNGFYRAQGKPQFADPSNTNLLISGYSIILSMIIYIYYRFIYFKISISNIFLGNLKLTSRLSLWAVVKITFIMFLIFSFFGVILTFIGFSFAGAIIISLFKSNSHVAAIILGSVTALTLYALIIAIWSWFWTARFIETLVETTKIEGTLDAATIRQSDLTAPNRGEGLLGAVDIGL